MNRRGVDLRGIAAMALIAMATLLFASLIEPRGIAQPPDGDEADGGGSVLDRARAAGRRLLIEQQKFGISKAGAANAPMVGANPDDATIVSLGLSRITGLRVPADLVQRAHSQEAVANAVVANLGQRLGAGLAPVGAQFLGADANANARKFDWTTKQVVTAARDQGESNACWAFASVGSFESAFAIRNRVRRRFSEQEVVNCSGAGTARGGGFYEGVFAYFQKFGAVPGRAGDFTGRDPFNAGSGARCNQPTVFKAFNYGYVSPQNPYKPSEAEIKRAIVAHGMISVGVYATPGFSDHRGKGVFRESRDYDPGQQPRANHAVLLVGWDDDKGAWIVRNSWGSIWGSQGFGFVAYRSNNIGTTGMWVDAVAQSGPVHSAQLGAMKSVVKGMETATAAGGDASGAAGDANEGATGDAGVPETVPSNPTDQDELMPAGPADSTFPPVPPPPAPELEPAGDAPQDTSASLPPVPEVAPIPKPNYTSPGRGNMGTAAPGASPKATPTKRQAVKSKGQAPAASPRVGQMKGTEAAVAPLDAHPLPPAKGKATAPATKIP